jgi:hypothetical protein
MAHALKARPRVPSTTTSSSAPTCRAHAGSADRPRRRREQPGGLSPGTNAVVLTVPSETALAALAARLQEASVPHVAIMEPDEPYQAR